MIEALERPTARAEAAVVSSPTALSNLEQAFAFLADRAPDAAIAAVDAIRSAVEMLAHHPLIGRIVTDDLRELVISFGRTGYVALYRFVPARAAGRVLRGRAHARRA